VHHRNDYLKILSYSLKEEVKVFYGSIHLFDLRAVYDPAHGEPRQNIPAGTSFEKSLPDGECPACSSGKDKFEKV